MAIAGGARARRGMRRTIGAVVAGLLVLVVLGIGSAVYARMQGLKVGKVATITQATYNAWNPATGNAPSPFVSTFAHGTKFVGIYYEVDGATVHKTTFRVQVKTADGDTILSPLQTASYINSSHGLPLTLNSSAKPGKWTITILVNGKAMGTGSFTLH